MDFKTLLEEDQAAFFNVNEFAEQALLEKKNVTIIVDNEKLQERSKVEYEGIAVGDLLFSIQGSELKKYGLFLKWNDQITLKREGESGRGQRGAIFDIRKDSGTFEIILKFNER